MMRHVLGRSVRLATSQRWFAATVAVSPEIVRIGTEDPRMSKIVLHQGIVYTSGQTDTSAEDGR
jgi:hypothetical protein